MPSTEKDKIHKSNKKFSFLKRRKFWIRFFGFAIFVPILLFSILILIVYINQDKIIQSEIDALNKGHKGKITITAVPTDEFVEFSVTDDGPGISTNHQKHLFKKFYQVDTSVRRKHGGTGLGLSICKGICDGLGGKIWVTSQLDSGSTFYFDIPKEKKI